MMICSSFSTFGEILTVVLIITGVIAVLVCLQCGSDYLLNKKEHPEDNSPRNVDELRRESDDAEGISRYSVFYKFFFRP